MFTEAKRYKDSESELVNLFTNLCWRRSIIEVLVEWSESWDDD